MGSKNEHSGWGGGLIVPTTSTTQNFTKEIEIFFLHK